ncbi:hypothetical protein OG921_26355 [Aldersonia sp. NBC_00410]|uniref:hypothetical protein n=1 Tax=Aldersonia sp. NBC_00410 TaxID=2975954 RepID=UPI00225BE3A4|nr:hypothetical protein [Aldersonia sp. NBC_00410]MCX5046702.1 hypothetical protein [Aldersonia sp. NBC_00410]
MNITIKPGDQVAFSTLDDRLHKGYVQAGLARGYEVVTTGEGTPHAAAPQRTLRANDRRSRVRRLRGGAVVMYPNMQVTVGSAGPAPVHYLQVRWAET